MTALLAHRVLVWQLLVGYCALAILWLVGSVAWALYTEAKRRAG